MKTKRISAPKINIYQELFIHYAFKIMVFDRHLNLTIHWLKKYISVSDYHNKATDDHK